MAKQPYIPFYIGDYIRDTRMLPLNARGAWVDIILQSWDNEGEVIGTIEDIARMISCSTEEAILVIQILKQKKIFDWEELPNGETKIICRRVKKMKQISETRKLAGIKGGNPNLVNQNKKRGKPKVKQNPEYDNEYDNENENENINEIKIEKYLFLINSLLGKKFRVTKKLQVSFSARIKEGYTLDDFKTAIENAKADQFHIDTGLKHLAPDFFLRPDKLEKWLHSKSSLSPEMIGNKKTEGKISPLEYGRQYQARRLAELEAEEQAKKIAG